MKATNFSKVCKMPMGKVVNGTEFIEIEEKVSIYLYFKVPTLFGASRLHT